MITEVDLQYIKYFFKRWFTREWMLMLWPREIKASLHSICKITSQTIIFKRKKKVVMLIVQAAALEADREFRRFAYADTVT